MSLRIGNGYADDCVSMRRDVQDHDVEAGARIMFTTAQPAAACLQHDQVELVDMVSDAAKSRVIAADRQAIIEQQQRDAALSGELMQSQAVELGALRTRSATVITGIEHAPSTSGCGPVMRDASRGLQQLFAPDSGGPPAGRQPAAAVR